MGAGKGQVGEYPGPSPSCAAPPPGAVGFLTILSKGCSKECVEDSENYLLAKKNIACCSTDLCDFSGAHALQPPLVTMVPLPALGGLLLWGPSQV